MLRDLRSDRSRDVRPRQSQHLFGFHPVELDSSRGLRPVQTPTMNRGVEEQALPHGPAIVGGVASRTRALGGVLRSQLPSPRRATQLAAGLAVTTFALWSAAGAAGAGLGLLALLAAATALRRPYLLGPLVALLLPFGDRVHVLHAQVAPLEAAIGGGAIGYVAGLALKHETIRLRLCHWIFAGLVVFIGLSALGPAEDSRQARDFLLWGALGCLYHAVTTHLDRPGSMKLLLVGLAVPMLGEAALALFEYVDTWSQRFSRLNGAIVYPLPKGTLEHPNALAQFLVLTSFAVVALVLLLGMRGLPRRLGLLAAGAGGLALVVTFSRASWIAFAVASCVYTVERKVRGRVVLAGAVVAAGAAVLALVGRGAIGERISSLFTSSGLSSFRIELWESAVRIAAAHPVTGTGYFRETGIYAGRPDIATHPHNLFLGLAVFYGIPAAAAFGGLVLLATRATWRGARQASVDARLGALGFLAVLVVLLVNGIFEYPFWNVSLTTLVVLLLAISVTLDRKLPEGHTLLADR